MNHLISAQVKTLYAEIFQTARDMPISVKQSQTSQEVEKGAGAPTMTRC